jgi:hypothetical protein
MPGLPHRLSLLQLHIPPAEPGPSLASSNICPSTYKLATQLLPPPFDNPSSGHVSILTSCTVQHTIRSLTRLCRCCLQAFHTLYHTDENVLLGAPTGSGKTISSELTMLRVFNEYPGGWWWWWWWWWWWCVCGGAALAVSGHVLVCIEGVDQVPVWVADVCHLTALPWPLDMGAAVVS